MDEQVTREPVLLQRIDYDREGHLVLILNQHVTNEWVRDFWGVSDVAFFSGKEPRNFSFNSILKFFQANGYRDPQLTPIPSLGRRWWRTGFEPQRGAQKDWTGSCSSRPPCPLSQSLWTSFTRHWENISQARDSQGCNASGCLSV